MSNNKLEEVESNNSQLDSLYEYIIEQQSEKLNKIMRVKTVSLYCGYFSTLAFLILLVFRVSFIFSWLYLLAFALSAIISFTVFLNMYLKLQDILHEEMEKLRNEDTGVNIGSMLSYFCLNISALCLSAYIILAALKLNDMLHTEWNVIAIPLFILSGIGLFFTIFIMPAFLTNRLYLELGLLFSYFISAFMFMVFINLKLDKEIYSPFKHIFIPVIIALSLNLGFCLFLLFSNKDKQVFKMKIIYVVSVALLLTSAILIPIKLDNELHLPGWVPVILVFFAVLLLIYDDIAALFLTPSEEEDLDLLEKGEKKVELS
jgi:hypothetical protein